MTEGAADSSEPRPRSPAPSGSTRRRPSRRAFLLGGGAAVLAGAGAGTAIEFRADRVRAAPAPPPPTVLLAALTAERDLLAGLDAALATPAAADDADRALLRQVRADHAAHASALDNAVALAWGRAAPTSTPAASAGPTAPPRPPATARLRAAETAAARAAAGRAATLHGRDATLLASISACEAGHAELLR